MFIELLLGQGLAIAATLSHPEPAPLPIQVQTLDLVRPQGEAPVLERTSRLEPPTQISVLRYRVLDDGSTIVECGFQRVSNLQGAVRDLRDGGEWQQR